MRIGSLDALRLGAVLFVVVQHSLPFVSPDAEPGPFLLLLTGLAVPVIFVIAGFLDGATERGRTDQGRLWRVHRLFVPYIFWAVFYTMFFAIQARIQGVPMRLPSLADAVTGQGVYFILWFLPTLLVCTVVGWLLPTPRRSLAAGVVGLATWLAASAGFGLLGISPAATDAGNVLFRLPYFIGWYLISRALGLARVPNQTYASWPWLTVFGTTGLTLCLMPDPAELAGVVSVIAEAVSASLFGAAALALMALAIRVPQLGGHLTEFWRSVAPYGIYLTHMLFLEAADHLLPNGTFDWRIHSALLTLLGFFGSAALVAASTRIRGLRPAFGLAAAGYGVRSRSLVAANDAASGGA